MLRQHAYPIYDQSVVRFKPIAQQGKFGSPQPQGFVHVADQPVSTFSANVDTASYALTRRLLTSHGLPPPQAVRVEEMVNYFPYSYAASGDPATPFKVQTTITPSPWKPSHQLLHIALKGYMPNTERPKLNLVLLIDTSGSMAPIDRLPLLKPAFEQLIEQLRPDDRMAIVSYASDTRVDQEPLPGDQKAQLTETIRKLQAHGGTAGHGGLERAYALAHRHFDPKAVNRIILATDGDFNIGSATVPELKPYIAAKRKTGIYLTILGVGLGNLNDHLMQSLAQAGNGNAYYIDSPLEARKALIDELASTMVPIADDVKIQIEFNPLHVASYRLIGYETRMLQREDFKDDSVDAGELGAGHTVTAIYEIASPQTVAARVDGLRYQAGAAAEPTKPPKRAHATAHKGIADELAFVRVRYKLPGQSNSQQLTHPVARSAAHATMATVPVDQRFATAVAAFGQKLRHEPELAHLDYVQIADLALSARGEDLQGYRNEFVKLVRLAAEHSKAGIITDRQSPSGVR